MPLWNPCVSTRYKIMRMVEKGYDEFADDHFPNMVEVRVWNDCKIWTAGTEECLVVLLDTVNRRVTVFDYDTPAERQEDIDVVLGLRDDDGDTGAGVPARLSPSPPGRSSAFPGFASIVCIAQVLLYRK